MTDLLQRCRVVWGRTDRIAALPALRVVTDAVYRPATVTAPWVLTGPDGTLLESQHSRDTPLEGTVLDSTVLDGSASSVAGEDFSASAEPVPHLYLGPLTAHYGHFLVGTLGRLWPLLAWRGPPPRLLYQGGVDPAALPFLASILAGFGLAPRDLVRFSEPTRIPHLVLPEPSLKEQAFAHAVHADLVRAIGRPFWADAAVDAVARPVYLSKARLPSGISRLRNEAALEAALARRGVDIIDPETLGFGDLVRLFSERRVVMGTTGSAFHTAAFAAPGRRILGLNWAPHLNANFPLLDALNGTQGRYYHPAGSEAGPDDGFQFGWSVPDPEGVAEELVRRAADFDGLEALDAGREAAQRRAGRGPLKAWLGRWLGRP